MRKNFKNRKALSSVKVKYEITGLNQDRLLQELKKRDFTLYDVKKLSNRVMVISVNLQESENFFAITKNLCYNVKKVKLFGKGLPVYNLIKNFGLVLGALVFLAVAVISNDFIFDFNYSGSGKIYSRQVSEYLEGRKIAKFTRFSSFSTERLEDEILADNPNLTFVSVVKKGNTLDIYLTLKSAGASAVSGRALELRASEDGVIESLKIYRGTPLVSVGDTVKAGDLLVEGYAMIKDQRVQTGVLAYITLTQEQCYTYKLKGLNKEDIALTLASEEQPEKQIITAEVTVKEVSGEKEYFYYTVIASYRRIIYSK